MAIRSISGYAGSGKDTVGQLIQIATSKRLLEEKPFEVLVQDHQEHQWWLEHHSGWEIKKWAGKLKEVASILTGIPVMEFENQEFKKTIWVLSGINTVLSEKTVNVR